jgi:hypothetical protein
MADHATSDGWIGACLLRKEDTRHLMGAGQFVADVRVPGLQDIAFVRSQHAHAGVRQVIKLYRILQACLCRALSAAGWIQFGPEGRRRSNSRAVGWHRTAPGGRDRIFASHFFRSR